MNLPPLVLLAFAACTPTSKPEADEPASRADTGDPAGADSGAVDSGVDSDGPIDSPDSGTPPDDSATDTSQEPDVAAACTDWTDPVAMGTVADAALDELSDLVPSRQNPGVLWTHEDSGGRAELYAIAPTGETLGTLTITGAENQDWEDLAVAECPDREGACLWIADTGDNGLSRDDVALLVVPEPDVGGSFTGAADPVTYRFEYPDGRGNAEGMGIGPDGLPVLVTKRVDGTADVYRFPRVDPTETVTLEHLGRVQTGDADNEHPAEATAADVRADGNALLVRTYGYLLEYPFAGGVLGDPVSLPAPDEGQGEAAGYDADGAVWLVSEGGDATIWRVGCVGG